VSTKPSTGERLRYWFDNWMSKGTVALMALLGVATFVFVAVFGTIAWLIIRGIGDFDNYEEDQSGPLEFIWRSLMRTLDPGTMGGDQGWVFRILMLVVTIGGLIIVASLIGIVSGAFDSKVEELRKGRSRLLKKRNASMAAWTSKVSWSMRADRKGDV